MKKSFLFLRIVLVLCTIAFSSCSVNTKKKDTVTLGTFNIAWLGDGENDREKRSDSDYERIAGIIKDMNADVIGLQEIENEKALRKVMNYLDDYQCFVGNTARGQNVAFLYKNEVEVTDIKEYMPVAIHKGRNRPGLIAHCKKGNFDWSMMVVHLKSTSRYDSTDELRQESRETRRLQAAIMTKWVDSVAQTQEKDIIIVGDFNDFPLRKKDPTLTALLDNQNIDFLTKERKSCKDEKLYAIDHIVVSKSAKKRFVTGSDGMVNFYASEKKEIAQKISDHCPVVSTFDIISPDND